MVCFASMQRILPLLFLTVLSLPLPSLAEGPIYVLTAGQWAVPRSGERLLRLPAVVDAVEALDPARAGGRLRIHYPGGDEGTLWARELRAWLVALGLGSERIELVPGSSAPDRLELTVARDAGADR